MGEEVPTIKAHEVILTEDAERDILRISNAQLAKISGMKTLDDVREWLYPAVNQATLDEANGSNLLYSSSTVVVRGGAEDNKFSTPAPFLAPSNQEFHDVLYFLSLMSAFLEDEEEARAFFPLLQQELKSKITEIRERSLEFHTSQRIYKAEHEADEKRLALVSVADHFAAAKKDLEEGISNLAEEQALFAEVADFGKHIEAILNQDGNIVSSIFLKLHQGRLQQVRTLYLNKAAELVPDVASSENLTTMLPHLRKAPNMLAYMGIPAEGSTTSENPPWNYRKNPGARKKEHWLQFTDNGRCPPGFVLGLPDAFPAPGENSQFDSYKSQFVGLNVEDFNDAQAWADFKSDAKNAICHSKGSPEQPDLTQLVAVGGTVSVRSLAQVRNGLAKQLRQQRSEAAAEPGAEPMDDSGDDGTALLGWLGQHQAQSAAMLGRNLREKVKFDRIAEGGLATIRQAVGRRMVQPALVLAHNGERWRAQRVLQELRASGRPSARNVWPPQSISDLFEDVLGKQADIEKTKLVATTDEIPFRYKHNENENSAITWDPVFFQKTLRKRPLHTGSLVFALSHQLLYRLWQEMEKNDLVLVLHNLQVVERKTANWSSSSSSSADHANAIITREVEDVVRDVVFVPVEESRKDLFLENGAVVKFVKDGDGHVSLTEVGLHTPRQPFKPHVRRVVSELARAVNFPANKTEAALIPVCKGLETADKAGRENFIDEPAAEERACTALKTEIFLLAGTVEIRASDFAGKISMALRDEIEANFHLGDLDAVKRPLVKGYDEVKVHTILRDGRVLAMSDRPAGSEAEVITSTYFNDRYFRQDRSPDTTARGTFGMITFWG